MAGGGSPAGGASISRVSLDCASCGGSLEPVRAASPFPERPPLSDDEKRELERAYKEQRRAEFAARWLPPALKGLFEFEDRKAPPRPPTGCLAFLGFVLGGVLGYDQDPDGPWPYALAAAGAGAGYLLGAIVGWLTRRGRDA